MKNKLQIYCIIIITIATKAIFSSANVIDNVTVIDFESTNNNSTETLPTELNTFDEQSLIEITDDEERDTRKLKNRYKNLTANINRKNSIIRNAVQVAALEGLRQMVKLYEEKEPEIFRKGDVLEENSPGEKLALFSAPDSGTEKSVKAAYASLEAAKKLKKTINFDFTGLGRQAGAKISLKRTPLEGLCKSRTPPRCPEASLRYRTHDGTCNNQRHPRWGQSQLPFNRFLTPDYVDGIEKVRISVTGSFLPSARFVSLLVHGAREGDAPVTMLLAQWGQFIDHDLTSTAQPRSINGTVPRCCDSTENHPACLPIPVPLDDPWLSPMGLRCLEFLRSAPAQRLDCVLSWREQTNQATSYLDASTVYSSSSRSSDNARIFRDGLLLFGRGPPREDVCLRGALANQCIRPGDKRSGEQPGLLAMHTIWVGEHNRIAIDLGGLNSHWSDEKLYQEARRIVGAMVQHITYREFLPLVLGKEVCKLFDLELKNVGYYEQYDARVNPTVANSFGAAAFRFGHSLIQGSLLRCDRNHHILDNNVTLHDEFAHGDMGGTGSLHRLVRGLAMQRALKRDEFISPELTNHLFQTGSFPFGLDLAAINIQRGRDHGLPSYTNWRSPCGLSEITNWKDLENVVGPKSTERIRQAYRHVDDIDLFVGGLAERPVVGGLVGPTFSCIIAQQFSNIRKGDRFWYENPGFESSFTPAQLQSIRQVSLSQVLCRALGGGTLQPNVFLPPELPGNDRILCGSKSMIPIDLLPWTERDPFNKNNVVVEKPFSLSSSSSTFSNSKKKKPTKSESVRIPIEDDSDIDLDVISDTDENGDGIGDKLDFADGVLQKQKVNKTESIDNKLDFSSLVKPLKFRNPTTAKPQGPVNNKLDVKRKPTTNAQVVLTNSNNKLDLTNKNTPNKVPLRRKRPTTNKNRRKSQTKKNTGRRQDDFIYLDGDDIGTIDLSLNHFSNQDNATGYWDNKAVTTTEDYHDYNDYTDSTDRDNDKKLQLKHIIISTPSPNSYDIEINIRPNSQSYRPTTSNRPYMHQNIVNNPPSYNSNNNVQQSTSSTSYYDSSSYRPTYTTNNYPTSSFQMTNKYSTPFSYDATINKKPTYLPRPSSSYINRPSSSYTNGAYSYSTNRPYSSPYTNRYEHTTRKPDLQTFFIVETTRPTSPIPFYSSYRPTPTKNYNNRPTFSYNRKSGQTDPAEPRLKYVVKDTKDKIDEHKTYDTADYDLTTYTSILNENFNIDDSGQNTKVQFDLDGYLRPDMHIINIRPKNITQTPQINTDNKSTKYVYQKNVLQIVTPLPTLGLYSRQTTTGTRHNTNNLKAKENDLTDKSLTNVDFKKTVFSTSILPRFPNGRPAIINDKLDVIFSDSIPRIPSFNIQSADYDEDDETKIKIINTEPKSNIKVETRAMMMVPLQILTKPERPDNWLIFDAPIKPPLPQMPPLSAEKGFSIEFPRPILQTHRQKKTKTMTKT